MHDHIPSMGRPLRVGSLFSGYGGLDLAVEHVFNAETVWFSEINEPIARVFSHHWPEAPNLGDITTIDWNTVPPVDILCGGFPCQDVSTVGKQAGLAPGTRSGLWSHMAAAIEALQPKFVVIENVRGLLSAPAVRPSPEGATDAQQNPDTATPRDDATATVRDLEPDPWGLGDESGRSLRAFGAVAGDLADLRRDARWIGLPASEVGAPHQRFRVFVLAQGPVQDAVGLRLLPRRGEPGTGASPSGHDRAVPSDHRSRLARTAWLTDAGRRVRDAVAPDRGHLHRWGRYAAAIARWQHITARPAPAPALLNHAKGPRPAPEFVEWLMGLEAEWVTEPAYGLTDNQQLTILGNGVLPLQAACALQALLNM
ncbi:DNA cytosine methyltransferase [Brevibacterium casei]|nr:DNA (cytosine-5-)-methyltransferase [Brevibacterium casei]MCT1548988.1 DNA (cytosine-5-)-methyltransferase [Brevibacterium casei]MCT1558945.1 DNA (cytosine-5-)-methyltransferase [Brevibacterium casei]MCT2207198.1 DNA (cytosine-5-)-methyltransferase [Brevibacterium casei]QPR38062.1 DNA (cytosine-5-)-methyltransferase [Brevibacterium casei]QPR45351.1 DNA (cytosine-5-)-methyltransferase [Brevibacterium casei]